VNSYQGLDFEAPAGWTAGEVEGRFQLTPPGTTPDALVAVVLFGVETLNGRSLDAWFRARLESDLNPRFKVLQQSPPQAGASGALETISVGRTVEDPTGAVWLQINHAISDGQQAGLAVAITTSETAMSRHLPDLQALFQSLRLASPPPPADAAPGAATHEITSADIVGSWSHSSSSYAEYVGSSGGYGGSNTIAYADGYTFAADGTYTYIFTGMANSRYIRETDAGTWGFQSGNLVIRSKEAQREPKAYQILSHQVAPDGAVFMTVLSADYPRTEGNIGLYAKNWVRTPAT
jgi:hypothetical protein